MKRFMPLLFLIGFLAPVRAQYYGVFAQQPDPFSKALVEVLNAAPARFSNMQGAFLQYTFMQETEYRLTVDFPGSTAGIVRERDRDRNVYIEFRYATSGEANQGMKQIEKKMRSALGSQLYDPKRRNPGRKFGFKMFCLVDSNGYFNSNIELMMTRSRGSYLLPVADSIRKTLPEQHVILLKIQGGTPSYQYYIRDMIPEDRVLHGVLTKLIEYGEKDFSALKKTGLPGAKKKSDTLSIQGLTVYLDYRGGQHKAQLHIPVADGAENELYRLHKAIQSAAGATYVYSKSKFSEYESIVYFCRLPGSEKPGIYLRYEKGTGTVSIELVSRKHHPVSRSLHYIE